MLKIQYFILFITTILLSSVWGAYEKNSDGKDVFFFFAPKEYEVQIEKLREVVESNIKNVQFKIEYSELKSDDDYGITVGQKLNVTDEYDKYDGIFYNIHYIERFSYGFVNLKKYLNMTTINNYEEGPTEYVSYYNGALIGLPLLINYSTLYYNKNLLDKYELAIPATWEELYETIEIIYSKEISQNDDFIGYLGNLPPSSYITINTIQGLIHSYRDDATSKEVPSYTSENAIKALKLLKKIINNYSTVTKSKLPPNKEMADVIKEGNVLFANTYNFNYENYYNKEDVSGFAPLNFAPLPGREKGISSSSISGYNIGIPTYLSESRIKEVAAFIDKIASLTVQEAYVKETKNFSPLKNLYKNENKNTENQTSNKRSSENGICSLVDCEMIYNLEFYKRPSNSYGEEYETFVNEFYELLINGYIFGRISEEDNAAKTLKKIDDLTRYYNISPSSFLGIFVIGLLAIIIIAMIVSYIMMFNRKYNKYFVFLNNTYWGIFLYGTILILMYGVVNLGEITQSKCNLRFVLLTLGIPISFSPLLLQLIVLYPESNKVSNHVNRNFSNYLCCHILFELFLCTLYLFTPFTVVDHHLNISDGLENYRTCECTNNRTKILVAFNIFEKGAEIVAFAILIFAEWNISATKTDIISLTAAIVLDIFAFTLYAIFYFNDFKLKTTSYLTKVGPVLLFGLSNLFMIYLWKFTIVFSSKREDIESKEAYVNRKTNTDLLKNVTRMNLMNVDGRMGNNYDNNADNFLNKIMKAHHETAQSQGDIYGGANASNRVVVNSNNY